jgi:hypothetical protein
MDERPLLKPIQSDPNDTLTRFQTASSIKFNQEFGE